LIASAQSLFEKKGEGLAQPLWFNIMLQGHMPLVIFLDL